MSTTERIYMVLIGENARLIRAAHPSQALTYVAKDIARVTVATQQDLVDCLQDGIKVEDVRAE
jgi:hypothetical protein